VTGRIAPNPYSPYATAAAGVRHILPAPFLAHDPVPGTLAPTACGDLAVVPDAPVEVHPGEDMPDGACRYCVDVMNGAALVLRTRQSARCATCGQWTPHDGKCALCRQSDHATWWAAREAALAIEEVGG
jgi:hypothetical protein